MKEYISKYTESSRSGIPIMKVGFLFSTFPESLADNNEITIKQIGMQAGKNKTVEMPPLRINLPASITTKSSAKAIPHKTSAFFIL